MAQATTISLVQRVRHGDDAAFADLLLHHERLLYRFIRSETAASPDAGDWDELVQVASIGLYKAALAYAPERGAFTTLLGTVVRNELRLHRRRERRHAANVSLDDGEDPGYMPNLEDPSPGPEEVCVTHLDYLALREQLVRHLTLQESRVWLLHSCQPDLSTKELAIRLGKSPARVRNLLGRIRHKARAWLSNEQLSAESVEEV